MGLQTPLAIRQELQRRWPEICISMQMLKRCSSVTVVCLISSRRAGEDDTLGMTDDLAPVTLLIDAWMSANIDTQLLASV